jgi:hypothetical protein
LKHWHKVSRLNSTQDPIKSFFDATLKKRRRKAISSTDEEKTANEPEKRRKRRKIRKISDQDSTKDDSNSGRKEGQGLLSDQVTLISRLDVSRRNLDFFARKQGVDVIKLFFFLIPGRGGGKVS